MDYTPSDAAQIIVTIIPLVGIVAGCFVIFSYLLLSYKQKILMIEKDIVQKSFDIEIFSLLSGLILFGIGISLTIFFYLKEGLSYSILGGLFPLSVGLSLIIFFVIMKISAFTKKNEK